MSKLKLGQSEIKLLNHTADFGVVVRSPSLEDLFQDAARYMVRSMVAFPEGRGVLHRTHLDVCSADLADLMVRWLGEILYLFQGEGQLLAAAEVEEITSAGLSAEVELIPFDPALHEIRFEIKAVTYHQIEVAEQDGCWEARVIFDV